MLDPINEAIAKALKRDGLQEAENITGYSYKNHKPTCTLGLSRHLDAVKQRQAILSIAGDAYFCMPFERFLQVVKKNRFEQIMHIPFDGDHSGEIRQEDYYVFWNAEGLLLQCDSYTTTEQVINHGSIHYNWKPDKLNFEWTSSGHFVNDVFVGYHHYEAFVYNLNNMREHGHFISPWVERSLVWLRHWMDARTEEYKTPVFDKITEERIAMLPKNVQLAIQGNERGS